MLYKTKVELCWVQESLLLCKLLFKYINMDFANVFIARGNHYLQVKLLMPTLFALTEQTLITLHTTFTLHSPVLLNEIACETIVDIIELLSRYPLGTGLEVGKASKLKVVAMLASELTFYRLSLNYTCAFKIAELHLHFRNELLLHSLQGRQNQESTLQWQN